MVALLLLQLAGHAGTPRVARLNKLRRVGKVRCAARGGARGPPELSAAGAPQPGPVQVPRQQQFSC